jgi:hypothetical protein
MTTYMLIVLVALSMTNALEFQNLAEVQELAKSSNYASDIISTIQLKLQTGGVNGDNADEIGKLINDLLTQLTTDEGTLDTEYEAKKKELQGKLDKENGLLTGYKKTKGEQEIIVAARKKCVADADTNLTQYNAQLISNKNQKITNQTHRNADKQAWADAQTEHTALVAAIAAVRAKLSELLGSVEDKVKTAALNTREGDLDTDISADNSVVNAFTQLDPASELSVFVQLATKADQVALAKLISMLDDFKTQADATLEMDRQSEADSKTQFADFVTRIDADIVNLEKAIKDQEAAKKECERQRDAAQAIVDQMILNIAASEALIKSLTEEMADRKNTYDKQKYEIKCNRTTINKIKQIYTDRISNMSANLRKK